MMKINASRLVLVNTILIVMTLTLVVIGFTGNYLFIKAFIDKREPLRAAEVTLRSVPPKEPLCPGNDLDYIFQVQQLRSPLIARISRTIVSLDDRRTVIPQLAGDTELRIWDSLQGFRQMETYHIPTRDSNGDPIKPGMYELRVGVGAEGAAPSVFKLPFKVIECPVSKTQGLQKP